MHCVREINRLDELNEIRASWHALLRQTPGASFFQTLPWLEAYWRHFGDGMTFRVLVVGHAGRVEGIVPLVVYPETTRVGRLRVLSYPLHDWGSFYGPIGPDPAGVLRAGLEHVQRTDRNWDYIELRWCGAPETNPLHTAEAMRAAGMQAYATLWDRTAVVDLRGEWANYFAGRNGAWRNNFHRRQRKLLNRGALRFERYRPRGEAHADADTRWDLYEACQQLASLSWQASAEDGTTLSSESIRPFVRDVHEAAARCGAIDLNLLRLDERPVAFAYNYHWQGYVSGLRVGFDPEFARDGVGGLLWAMSIRDSFQRGDRMYDLGTGSLASKRHYRTDLLPILRFGHYPWSTPRAQVLRLRRWAEQHLTGKLPSVAPGQASCLSRRPRSG